jgi:hypothetical protein
MWKSKWEHRTLESLRYITALGCIYMGEVAAETAHKTTFKIAYKTAGKSAQGSQGRYSSMASLDNVTLLEENQP